MILSALSVHNERLARRDSVVAFAAVIRQPRNMRLHWEIHDA
jgi:hypothetical protein